MGPAESADATTELGRHQLLWTDFDEIARGDGDPGPLRKLRAAERSRRLLLMRGLVEVATKSEDLYRPLPSPETAWELLARVERAAPKELEVTLSHPYTGTWAGYTTRLYRHDVTGVCPFWVHLGYVHCLAAAAAAARQCTYPMWTQKGQTPVTSCR